MAQRLSGALQENILALLCFDNQHSKLIRNSIELSLFEGDYQLVASRAYDYIDKYKNAPTEHISDLFEDILDGDNARKSKRFSNMLSNIWDTYDGINAQYVIDQLTKFVRQQSLKTAIVQAANKVNEGTDEALDQAETILNASAKTRLDLFDPGIRLPDTSRSLAFLDRNLEVIQTGIKELDKYNLGPARKELWLIIGLAKRGKSWALIHLGRIALMLRYKVCHVTLENSAEITSGRYIQSYFAIPKYGGVYKNTVLKRDSLGRIIDFDEITINPKLTLDDSNVREELKKKIARRGLRLNNLRIKEFPMGSLTTNALKAYLDSLEMTGFIPDLLLVDYADLMKIDTNNLRQDLGRQYRDLRGLAQERNIAVATVSQSNRVGVGKKRIDEANAAEDWSKIGTVDVACTYNQTDTERELGLARIYVAVARNDRDKFTILITQNYNTGQFVIDSSPMSPKYWELIQ